MIILFVSMGVLRTLSGNSNQELITVWWQVFICQRLVSPLSVPLRDEMDANRAEPQRFRRAIPLLGSSNALALVFLSCGRQEKDTFVSWCDLSACNWLYWQHLVLDAGELAASQLFSAYPVLLATVWQSFWWRRIADIHVQTSLANTNYYVCNTHKCCEMTTQKYLTIASSHVFNAKSYSPCERLFSATVFLAFMDLKWRLANGPQVVRAIFLFVCLALLTFMDFKSFITLLLIPANVARETVMPCATKYSHLPSTFGARGWWVGGVSSVSDISGAACIRLV